MPNIEFDYVLSDNINRRLEKYGIHRRFMRYEREFCSFSLEQLAYIDKLKLNNVNSLSNIKYLKNLKKLALISCTSDVIYSEPLEIMEEMNHIQDFKEIEDLESLESLIIKNDIYIENLDIRKLKNLKELILTNNKNLKNLIGLDQLEKLESILIYGNPIVSKMNGSKYLKHTKHAKNNILDSTLFSNFIQSKNLWDQNILFAEETGILEYTLLTTTQMVKVYYICKKFIEVAHIMELDEYNKVRSIYQFITNWTKFDTKNLIHRNRKYSQKKLPLTLTLQERNEYTSIHSSYNAAILRASNCEGYVHFMIFMLRLLDIPCQNVYCRQKNSESYFTEHSMLRVYYQEQWYYCDISTEKPNEFDKFMKTKEEIQELYDLNSYDQQMVGGEHHGSFIRSYNK